MIDCRKLSLICLSAAAVTFAAASPLKLTDVAPSEDWAAEAESRLEELGESLKDAETFEEDADKIDQNAGVLAVLSQALAESPAKDSKINAAVLRDAAITIAKTKSVDEASAALTLAKAAFAGETDQTAEADFPWNKLIRMHPMMEEINGSNAKLRRALRRLRKPDEEARIASTIATLAVAMHADAHEVKDPADLPTWNALASEYQTTMSAMAVAMRAKDKDKALMLFEVANEKCDACHEKFQD